MDADAEITIPREVAHRLGYYVYLYVDPRTGKPFYVGKGRNGRVLAHLSEQGESRKTQTIAELRRLALAPRFEILAHGLPDEDTALRIEAAVIDLLGFGELTNIVRGWKSVQLGRLPVEDLIAYYAPIAAEIRDPAILIRVNKLYRHGMPDHDLYEATRGVWKLSSRRTGARLALAVFHGVVREVYVIESWHSAGSTPYSTRPPAEVLVPGRWEFIGNRAADPIRQSYFGRSVEAYFRAGGQSPVMYVGC